MNNLLVISQNAVQGAETQQMLTMQERKNTDQSQSWIKTDIKQQTESNNELKPNQAYHRVVRVFQHWGKKRLWHFTLRGAEARIHMIILTNTWKTHATTLKLNAQGF